MKSISYLNLKDINARYATAINSALAGVVDGGWYLQGGAVARFESEWAEYCCQSFCVGCGNGLDAIRLILQAWKVSGLIKDGDGVIVPANTFIATILAISQSGLKPVLVEPDIETYLISPSAIESAIDEKTRIILPVHLYGQMCEMDRISEIAAEHDLLILEDCAQCHGNARTVCQSILDPLHHACAWSFYPGKNLGALGDAGAVTTDSMELSNVVRCLSNYGSQEKYCHLYKGFNSRMDEFQAAVLSVKLRDLDRCNQRRIEIAQRYLTEINNAEIILPVVRTKSVFHIFPIRCQHRDALKMYLEEQKIQTQIHYPIPPHRQKAYAEFCDYSLPITELIADTELSLPCNQVMSDDDVQRVIDAINASK